MTQCSYHAVSLRFVNFSEMQRDPLVFDRAKAWGMRLDIPAGDCVGWKPGETKTITLVPFAGRKVARGFNHLTDGATTQDRLAGGLRRARDAGYADRPES